MSIAGVVPRRKHGDDECGKRPQSRPEPALEPRGTWYEWALVPRNDSVSHGHGKYRRHEQKEGAVVRRFIGLPRLPSAFICRVSLLGLVRRGTMDARQPRALQHERIDRHQRRAAGHGQRRDLGAQRERVEYASGERITFHQHHIGALHRHVGLCQGGRIVVAKQTNGCRICILRPSRRHEPCCIATNRELLHQRIQRRNHRQGQHGRGNHPAHHGRSNAAHHFRASTGAP